MPSGFTLADAARIAEFAHHGQKDQAGFDYIEHPKRVLAAVQVLGVPPYVQFAAVLHDVTEDTVWTLDWLRAYRVPDATLSLVEVLDRHLSEETFLAKFGEWREIADLGTPIRSDSPDAEDYSEYLRQRDGFYYHQILAHGHYAALAKSCDMDDNCLSWRTQYLSAARQTRLKRKYAWGRDVLTYGAIPQHHYTDERYIP